MDTRRADEFADWLTTQPGRYLMRRESDWIDHTVADLFGFYAIQLELPEHDLLRNNRIPVRIRAGHQHANDILCDPMALPFASQSVDLLVMAHTLDFHADPHQVLREAERVLMPEGRLLITGFNPWSLWGASRFVLRKRGAPWHANFLNVPRVKDWLALMGFQIASTRLMCFAPPFQRESWLTRFECLEFSGHRFNPVGGAFYGIEAVKRVQGMRLVAPKWKKVRVRAAPVPALDTQSTLPDPLRKS
ncbi:class I SAM-dependent methyltransferase [Burkholderiaceae bacterium DAT-1]|nr:class I SAM-dependent methyltransferase [Burkholderiaceae bacterium DAT-1]